MTRTHVTQDSVSLANRMTETGIFVPFILASLWLIISISRNDRRAVVKMIFVAVVVTFYCLLS